MDNGFLFSTVVAAQWIIQIINTALIVLVIYVCYLAIKALRIYIKNNESRKM